MKEKHNYKLSQTDKQEIALTYYLDRSNTNIQAICDKYSISKTYLYDIVKNNEVKDSIKKSIIKSEKNFTKRIDNIIDVALSKIENKLLSDDLDKTTYRDIAIMIGTLYDKSRLEQNLSTENKAMEINIKIEK